MHQKPVNRPIYRLFSIALLASLLFSNFSVDTISPVHAQEASTATPTPEATASPGQSDAPNASDKASKPIASQFIIHFKGNAAEKDKKAFVHGHGGTVVQRIDALNIMVIHLPDQAQGQAGLRSPIVESIEQDYYIDVLDDVTPPDDPRYAEQWALPAIGAPSAWAQMPADAPKVTVAVVDSGICASHPDLSGRLTDGWDFIESDSVPQDDFGHGCSVSGVIAANLNNGIGIAGVAPNAQIMPLRVLNASGVGSYSNVAAAIVYAADNGAQVINLSLGGSNPSSALENAVNYTISKGVIVVAAAGNNGTEGALYPAAYPDVIAVGSVDSDLQHSSFSNYGPQIDVWAPGRNILTTRRDGDYGLVNGTSFAAPYVAGAMGLAISQNHLLTLDGGILLTIGNPITSSATSESATIVPPTATSTPTEITTELPLQEQYGLVSTFKINRGSGPKEIGISAPAFERHPVGPNSITVDSEKNIFILDPINMRVMKIDALQQEINTALDLAPHIWGTDIAVDMNANLYLVDGRSNQILQYTQSGNLLASLQPSVDEITGIGLDSSGRIRFTGLLTSETLAGPATIEESISVIPQLTTLLMGDDTLQGTGIFVGDINLTLSGKSAVLRGPNVNITLPIKLAENIAAIPWFGIDGENNIYLLVETFSNSSQSTVLVNATIVKYDNSGQFITSFPIPNYYYATPQHRISLTSDGSIYQLLVSDNTIDILKWSSISSSENDIDPTPFFYSSLEFTDSPLEPPNDWENISSSEVEALSISRTQVINNAEAYRTYKWTPTNANCGSRTCPDANTGAACPVSQNKFPAGQLVEGVAYKWGGYDTIADFASKLSQGYLSGDVSGTTCVASCATGVDCSGFVSRVWNVGRYTTRNISQISTALASRNDVKAGDIFNEYSSHVVLFSHFDGAGNPVFYESAWTPAKVRLYSGWTYLNGYEPRRYNNITDDGGGGGSTAQCDVIKNQNGVRLFENTECNGNSKTYTSATSVNLVDVGFNDVARSIQIGPNFSVRVWQDIYSGANRCMKRSDTDGAYAFWDLYKDYYESSSTRIWSSNGAGSNITSIKVYTNETCYEAPQGPGTPGLTSPSADQNLPNSQSITFDWSDSGDSYTFELKDGPSAHTRTGLTGSSYSYGTLWPGNYQWRVTAFRSGQSAASGWRNLYIRPNTPNSISVTSNSTSALTINWGDSAGVDGYKIYRNGPLIRTEGGGVHNYQDTGLSCGTTYSYTVRAYKGTLESDAATANGTTSACPVGPDTPTLISPAPSGTSIPNPQSVTFDWSDSGSSYTFELTGGPAATTQTGLTSSQTTFGSLWAGVYQWRVTAFRNGNSAASGWWTLNVPPSAPGSVSVTINSTSAVTVNWTSSSGGVDGYKIYRNGNPVTTLGSSSSSHQITGLSCGDTATYSVRGYKGSLESAEKSATGSTSACPVGPSIPTLLGPSDGLSIPNPQSILFDWSASGDSYTVEITGGPSAGSRSVTTDSLNFGSMWPGVYQWRVRAFRNGEWSAWSNTWSFNVPPGAPGSVSVDTDSGSAVTVNWTSSPGGVDGYKIYRNESYLATVGGSTFNYQVTDLSCGDSATYSVVGYVGSLDSASRNASGSTAECPKTVHVLSAFITDENGTAASLDLGPTGMQGDLQASAIKTDFNAGENILLYMEVENQYDTPRTAYFEWLVFDPALREVPELEWSGNLTTSSGTILWSFPATIPSEALTGEYTFIGAITFDGEQTSAYYDFNVTGIQTVEVIRVYTTDDLGAAGLEAKLQSGQPDGSRTESGDEVGSTALKTIFNAGDPIQLYIDYYNNVSEGEIAAYEWSVIDPWGRSITDLSYSGDLDHYLFDSWWSLGGIVPANAITGTYTYTGTITHNGRTTSKTTTFYVNGAAAPANNNFGAPAIINTLPYTKSQDTWGATVAGTDPMPTCGSGQNSNSVWYRYTAPSTGLLEIDTWGSDYDTVVAVWMGTAGNLSQIDCNDDAYGNFQAWLEGVPVTAGVTYYIEVMDYGDPGGGQLELYVDFASSVANDGFGAPVTISTNPFNTTLNTAGATKASDDPVLMDCNRLAGEASVWYRYTPARNGNLELDTKGSNYDTMLAVWTGARGSLSGIGCNDDIGDVDGEWDSDSILTVPVSAGIPYYIEVSTYAGKIDINGASANDLENKPVTEEEAASITSLQDLKNAIEKEGASVPASEVARQDEVNAQFWGGQLRLHAAYRPVPAAFNKTSPANLATNQSLTPVLSWGASSSADSYEYCFDTSNDNNCDTWFNTGITTSASLSGLEPYTTYYWHVRASNSIDTTYANGSSTNFWSFTTGGVPGVFSKNSPANGATNQPLNLTLTWIGSTNATSYQYCYDTTDDNTCSTWTNNGASTSKALTGLTQYTTYYWHVRAINSFGMAYSNESETATWSFITGGVPGTFNKISPASGATSQPLSLTLTWEASSDATSYQYCYDTTNDNACSTWTDNGISTSKSLSGLSQNTTYYWHVRALNSFGTRYANGTSTSYWSFKTGGIPGAFNKTSPATGVINQPLNLTLSWGASPGATSYEYCYDTTNDNACSTWTNNGTSTSTSLSVLNQYTTYYWHVRSLNSFGARYSNGLGTAFWSFKTGGVPGVFNKSTPANGAANQPLSLTLTWAGSSNATAYHYCYDTTDDNTCSNWIGNGASQSKLLSGLSPYTTYYWHVRAVNSFGTTYANGLETAQWTFTTGGVPGAFAKSSPASGAINQPLSLTLTWAPSSGATSYAYCYDTTNDNACSSWTSNGAATSKQLTGLSQYTTYYWHVRAANSFGFTYSNGAATAFSSFRTGGVPGAFNKSSPANAATNQPLSLTLTWTASSNATSYQYCYDTTNDNTCSNWAGNGTSTSKTLNGLSQNTTYYWHLRAVNSFGTRYSNGSATTQWSFKTGGIPGTFNKSSPSHGAINQSTSPTLTWAASASAASYEYCYDTTNDNLCSDWISNSLSTSKSLGGLSYNTTYYWHVRAINSFGTRYANGLGTAFWSFKTHPAPVTQTFTAVDDGWVRESSESSNLGGSMNAPAATFYVGDAAGDRQYRAILSFNTFGLPDNAVITGVSFKIMQQGVVGTNPFSTHGNILMDIIKGAFSGSNALQLTDFQAAASANSVASITNTPSAGWYSKVLTVATYPYINKVGVTQFRLRFTKDDNDDLAADYLAFYSGDGIADNRPQLIIQYYIP
jgi:thermitase